MSSLSIPDVAMDMGPGGGPLIGPDEPPVVEIIAARDNPFVFVCEHASNRLPRALGDLGLPADALDRHIAWDPGAALLTRGLAKRFGGAALLQGYSRLVIDCNRSPELADAITPLSEETAIPGNTGLSPADRARRIDAMWSPFHAAIDECMEARRDAGRPTVLVTLHSFTPIYRGVTRPWHVGIIQAGDRRLADPMLAALSADAALTVGDEQPYSARDNVDYTIRRHGQDHGFPHVMIEVRNDLLRTPSDIDGWTARLGGALAASTRSLGIAVKDGG